MNKTLKFLSVPLAVTVIFGTLLSSYNVSADDTVDEINITVPVSCTMSGTGQDSHNATINNGQSNSSIGETTMKVFCNDNNGFAIYAIGYTDNTDGKNVLTSSTLGSTHDIVTGTVTSGDTSNWAMKLSTITDPAPTYPIIIAGSTADTDKEQGDPDFTSFQEVPDDYTLVAKRTSGTDINPAGQSTAEGATLKSTYQAYISKTQPAGTYTGQVKYTLLHPNDGPRPYIPQTYTTEVGKIGYYPNAPGVIDTMADQQLTSLDRKDWNQCTSGTDYLNYCSYWDDNSDNWASVDPNTLPDLDHYEINLWASNFRRNGYGFAGWNSEPDYTGTYYGPNERIDLPLESDVGLSLYAVWVQSSGTFQDFTASQCAAMATGQVMALTDRRDDDTYAISKFPDENCWMIENLRLDNTVTLSDADTNNPNAGFDRLPAPTNPNLNAWCTNANAECINQPMLDTGNIVLSSSVANGMTSPNGYVYSYGNYYNWFSATAGNGNYSMTYSNGPAPGDICSYGWRLPTLQEYEDLVTASGGSMGGKENNVLRRYPRNFLYSGSAIDNSSGGGSNGRYFTSSPNYYTNANRLEITGGVITAGIEWDNKYMGFALRCLLRTN